MIRISAGQTRFSSGAEGIRTPDLLIANGLDLHFYALGAPEGVLDAMHATTCLAVRGYAGGTRQSEALIWRLSAALPR